MGYLPLTAVIIVALAYNAGLGPIPWSFNSELFPIDVRAFMAGVTNCTASLNIFLVLKTFPALVKAMNGLAGVYWLYSGVCLLTVVFTFLVLPETKGKTMEAIADDFQGERKNNKQLDKDQVQ